MPQSFLSCFSPHIRQDWDPLLLTLYFFTLSLSSFKDGSGFLKSLSSPLAQGWLTDTDYITVYCQVAWECSGRNVFSNKVPPWNLVGLHICWGMENLGGFLGGASGKELICQCRRYKRCGFDPSVRKIPWRRAWQPSPVFWPREYLGDSSKETILDSCPHIMLWGNWD